MTMDDALPDVLVGPLLRRISPTRLVLWLVATRPLDMSLVLFPGRSDEQRFHLNDHHQCLPIGRYAFIHLIDLRLPHALPRPDERIEYDLRLQTATGEWQALPEWAPCG